jgi:hypothetical protein
VFSFVIGQLSHSPERFRARGAHEVAVDAAGDTLDTTAKQSGRDGAVIPIPK